MRLGLLLGDGTPVRPQRSRDSRDSPWVRSGASSRNGDSVCSLTSFEANTLGSDNTSPISTLTGSSEVEVHHHHRENDHRGVSSSGKEPSADSIGSLMSMSSQSNCSSSPLTRRHSVTSKYARTGRSPLLLRFSSLIFGYYLLLYKMIND